MKIRIITFQNAYNYGGSLQCYALQKKVKELGYNVEVLNYSNKVIDNVYKIIQIPRKKKYYLLRFVKSFIRCIPHIIGTSERNKKFRLFLSENIPLTKLLTKEEIIGTSYYSKDVFIVGSDQVWNTEITDGYDEIYTLDFNDCIKKISYAASFGFEKMEDKYKDCFANSLSKFMYISVREETGKKIINNLIDKQVEVVLDPTFLVEKEKWSKLVNKIPKEKERYIFVYMMDRESVKVANYVSDMTGLKIVYMTAKNEYNNTLRSAYNDGPYEFVKLIENAEYIITRSFHGIAFSIIFNKKFWVVPPEKISSRITDLLKKLGLSNRIVYNLESIKKKKIDEDYDYNSVNQMILKERKKSIEWLRNAIES